MAKKKVPDWLNSSLWSSPNPDLLPSHAPHDFSLKSDSPVKESPPPPVSSFPEPLGSKAYPTYAAKGEIRDPLINSGANYSDDESGCSSAHSTASAGGFSSAAISATLSASQDFSRDSSILQELSRKVINMGELRRLALQGIPDGGGIRALVWKLLLEYLPADRSLWPSELAKKRTQYKHFKEDLLVNPLVRDCQNGNLNLENQELVAEGRGFLSRSDISHGEHPLSLGKNSVWNQFFQDTEIMVQIDRDVKRTHPDIDFFSGQSNSAKSNQDALKNILFVFAKLNPGIKYVQGMNEILALLFYVIRNDPNGGNVSHRLLLRPTHSSVLPSYGVHSKTILFNNWIAVVWGSEPPLIDYPSS